MGSLCKVINYTNPSNFTFPSTVEVTTRAALSNQINVDEVLYNDFLTADLFRYIGGSPTSTLNGAAAINAGKLEINGGTGYWHINPTGMLAGTLGGVSNVASVRFKVTPQYTGSPATNQYFYEEKRGSGANRIWIYHNTGGNLAVEFRDSAGSGQGTLSTAWSPVSGTEYEIELNINTTTGTQKIYIDGVQLGADHGATFNRDNSTTDNIFIGVSSISQTFFMDDLQRFSTIQHTADFASEVPTVVPLTTYAVTDPSIIESGALQVDGLTSFAETSTIPVGTDIKHILNIDTQDKYWDGAAWVNSNGTLAQSNYFSVMNTNIAALDVSAGVDLKIKSLLSSPTGVATPELTVVNLCYDFYAAVINPLTCEIYGYVYDGVAPVLGATIDFKSRSMADESANFIHINEQAVTDANGYFEITLPSTVRTGEDDIKVDVVIKFVDSKLKNAKQNITIIVPASNSSSLEDAIVNP